MNRHARAIDQGNRARGNPTRGRMRTTTNIYVQLAVVFGVVALTGCAQKAPGAPTPGGSGIVVTGTVTASPGCPGPQRVDSPCPNRPVAGAPVEFAANGAIVATTNTDDTGRFRIAVPPGVYEITARNVGYFSRTTQTVSVTGPMDLSLVVDSGMR